MKDLYESVVHLLEQLSEDAATEYLTLPDIRLVFREGEYVGWFIHE